MGSRPAESSVINDQGRAQTQRRLDRAEGDLSLARRRERPSPQLPPGVTELGCSWT